jgi:hypothetical protein
LSLCAKSGECCDSNEGFFHFKVLQGLNRGSEFFRTNLRIREVACIEPDERVLDYDNSRNFALSVACVQQNNTPSLTNPRTLTA